MRLLKGFFYLLSVLVIFSCATTKDQTTPVKENVSTTNDADTNEKKMIEKEVVETFYYVTKEDSFYGDGQIDSSTTYTYNTTFDLLKKVQTNEQGEVLESNVNSYENGLLVKQSNYGFANALNTYYLNEYDADGLKIRDILFDKADKIQSINEYEYDNGLVVIWRTLGPSEGPLALTTYEYNNNGDVTSVSIKDAGGAIDGVIEKYYTDGLLSEEKLLDNKGRVEKSTTYSYTDGKLLEKIFFDSKGKKKRSESFEYKDNMPVPSKIIYHYKSGAIEAYKLMEYDSKVITTTILVEE